MIGEATTVAKRPVIRYHGGKWMLELSPSTDQALQRMGGLFGEHAQAVTP